MEPKLVFTDKTEKMTVIAYCSDLSESFDRNGKKYVKAILRDLNGETRTVTGFDQYYEYYNFMEVGKVYEVDVFYDSKYYTFVNSIGTESKEHLPEEYLGEMCYGEDYKKRFTELYLGLKPPFHELLQEIFYHNKADFIKFGNIPFSKQGAYNKRGGVFKLTVDLANFAKLNATASGLDTDLCVAAALIYNMGEIDNRTLMGDDVPEIALLKTSTNTINRFVEANVMLRQRAKEKEKEGDNTLAQELSESQEEFLKIQHILGIRDSIDIPAIPEAILIREGFEFCKKMDMCYRGLETLKPGQSTVNNVLHTAAYKSIKKKNY